MNEEYIDTIIDIASDDLTTIVRLKEESLIIPTMFFDSKRFTKGLNLTETDKYTLYEKAGLNKPIQYINTLLKNRRYSEKQLVEKTKSKFSLSEYELNSILDFYKGIGQIDDVLYAMDYIKYKGREYGKKIVEEKLKQKGIDECIIYSEDVQHCFNCYKDLLIDFLTRKLKYKKFKSISELKQYLIHQAYLKKYSKDEIDYALYQLEKQVDFKSHLLDEESKNNKLIVEAEKIYRSLAHESDKYKKRAKFISKLKAKGYSNYEISSVVEERGLRFDD